MNEERDELIGFDGVDTEYERDILEYDGETEYNPNKKRTSLSIYDDKSEFFSEDDSYEEHPDILNTWNTLIEITNDLEEQIEELKEKIGDIQVQVNESYLDSVKEYFEKVGITFNGYITAEIYELIYSIKPQTNISELIKNIFEETIADVYGNLNAELFTNLLEMNEDWKNTLEFAKMGLYGQIIDYKTIKDMKMQDESVVQEIESYQEKYKKEYELAMGESELKSSIFMKADLDLYSDEEINKMMDEVDNTEIVFDILKRKGYTSNEINLLIESKSELFMSNLELVRNATDLEVYDNQSFIIESVLRQFNSKEEMLEGLENMRMSLKLASDVENSGLMKDRLDLRGLSGNDVKQTISNNLLLSIQLKNNVLNKNYEILRTLDVSENEEVDVFMNAIVKGTKAIDTTYKDQVMDYYKITQLDNKLREQKITKEIQKELIRSSFKMVDGIYEYLSNESGSFTSSDASNIVKKYENYK